MKYFDLNQRPFLVGGFTVEHLAERYQTPLYVYDGGIIEQKYHRLRSAMPKAVDIFYALKSNSALAIATLLRRLGAGCEIASLGELQTAQRAGFMPENIIFAGPGKRDDEILAAIDAGIYTLNVESLNELNRVNDLAGKRGKRMPIELRVSTGFELEESVSIIGGSAPKKFGIDMAEIDQVCKTALLLPNIILTGFHVFNASQVLDWQMFSANVEKVIEMAVELSQRYQFPLRSLDIGGGLGTPYMPHEQELDVMSVGERINNLLEQHFPLEKPRVIVEPGRYLSCESGLFITRVIDKKQVGSKEFFITDGGIHQLLRPALIKQNHYLINASRPATHNESGQRYQVAGPLCTGLDLLARDVEMAAAEVGDLIVIFNAGAYGYSESMPFFLSHPIPAEVLVYQGDEGLIRPRIEPSEYLAQQFVPDFIKEN